MCFNIWIEERLHSTDEDANINTYNLGTRYNSYFNLNHEVPDIKALDGRTWAETYSIKSVMHANVSTFMFPNEHKSDNVNWALS